MLRLDPTHPPLWRDAHVLQLGEAAVAMLTDPAPWQLALLRELEHGLPESAVPATAAMCGAPGAVDGFLAELGDALIETTEAQAAGEVRLRAARHDPDADAVTHALATSGYTVRRADDDIPGPAVPTVVLRDYLIDPIEAAALVRDDLPHVPILREGRSVMIGPRVQPGVTGCLVCVNAHRRDEDARWPLLASQLLARRAPALGPALGLMAGLIASVLLREPATGCVTESVTLTPGSVRQTWRSHHPHPDCRCGSPPEIGTLTAPSGLDLATNSDAA